MPCRSLTSLFLVVVVVVVKVFSLDRLQQRLVEQNTLTFQFRDVVGQAVEVLKVYTQDRVQHPFDAEQNVDIPVSAGGGPQLPDHGGFSVIRSFAG